MSIPDHMQDAMDRYINQGIPPGSFLTAVLSNDLMGAFSRADVVNQHAMMDYVRYLYNDAPGGCHGSPERYNAWIAKGGLQGRAA